MAGKFQRCVLFCLLILGSTCSTGAAGGDDPVLRVMNVRLQICASMSSSVQPGPEELAQLILGEGRQGGLAHVVGISGLSDASQVEDFIWPLNRSIGPNERSYVTWLTGGGKQAGTVAVVSLFPLVSFEELSWKGAGLGVLYAVLDAPGGAIHVVLVGDRPVGQERLGFAVPVERLVGRLLELITRDHPQAQVILMGDVKPELLSTGDAKGVVLQCAFCTVSEQETAGVIMVHPGLKTTWVKPLAKDPCPGAVVVELAQP